MTPDDLKTHLKALDWSQAELARRVGVTSNTVYRWAAGLLALPVWLTGYLDMVAMVRRCVTQQATVCTHGVPLAVYDLADRVGVRYPAHYKDQQREYEKRLQREVLKEWLPPDEA